MIRIVRLSFQPEHTNDFTALFEARKLNIRAVAGCTHLELWRDQEQLNVFYTYSHWEHPDDLENYRVSEFFKDTWQTIKPWFNAPAQAFFDPSNANLAMTSQLDYSGAEARWECLAKENVMLLADANTHGFCLPVLFKHMPFLQGFPRIVVPAGEAAKDLDVARYIWQELHRLGAKNNTVLLVVGGGALCDVGAFCASVYKRGMRLRLVPTTLLAMVDAALGGKTAIDFEGIKNSLGSFYAAEALYVQPAFLNTLPERQRLSGIAEMIKHALLDGGNTWENIVKYTPEQFTSLEAIQTSQSIKMRFVEADPYDKGIRQCLNLGHSIGHALEAERMKSAYPLLHGEAILWGMYLELYLSIGHCGLLPEVWQQYTHLFRRLFPALQQIAPIQAEAIMPYLMHDKKNTEGIRMSLISSPGSPIEQVSVSTSSIFDAIYENCYQ